MARQVPPPPKQSLDGYPRESTRQSESAAATGFCVMGLREAESAVVALPEEVAVASRAG
jgi:hypothetical protein